MLLLAQFEIVGPVRVDHRIDTNGAVHFKLARSDQITKHYLLSLNTIKKWLYLSQFLSKSHDSYVVRTVSSRATRALSHQVT